MQWVVTVAARSDSFERVVVGLYGRPDTEPWGAEEESLV